MKHHEASIESKKQRSLLDAFRVRKFSRSEDGAVGVEFSLIALPFFMIIAFFFEMTINYFAAQTLNNAVERLGRQIRTNQITSSATYGEAEFRQQLCADPLLVWFKCADFIIDVRQIASFQDLGTPRLPDGTIDDQGMGFNPGGRTTINVMRVYYEFPIYAGWLALGPAEYVSKGTRTMSASQAFMIEP